MTIERTRGLLFSIAGGIMYFTLAHFIGFWALPAIGSICLAGYASDLHE